jgi:hypothetical protein
LLSVATIAIVVFLISSTCVYRMFLSIVTRTRLLVWCSSSLRVEQREIKFYFDVFVLYCLPFLKGSVQALLYCVKHSKNINSIRG